MTKNHLFTSRTRKIHFKWIVPSAAFIFMLQFIFVVCSTANPTTTEARSTNVSHPAVFSALDRLAKDYDLLIQNHRIEQASVKLNQMERLLEQQGMMDTSLEGKHILLQTLSNVKQTLAIEEPDEHALRFSATQLRLLIDSVAHPNDPMWKQFRSFFFEKINQFESSLLAEYSEDRDLMFKNLNEAYQLIRPALSMNKASWVVEKGDSFLAYFSQAMENSNGDLAQVQQVIFDYRTFMESVFEDTETATTFPVVGDDKHPFVWTISIGSFIIAILAFHAYGRFRYEQNTASVVPRQRKE